MASIAYYLPPVLTMVALPYFTAALILLTRLGDIVAGRRTVNFYEDYAGVGASALVQRTTNQLKNLFEFPVLFYALVSLCVAGDLVDAPLRDLAWAFVAGRWSHAVVHLSFNKLWVRLPIFMASNLILFGMWIRVGLLVLGTAK